LNSRNEYYCHYSETKFQEAALLIEKLKFINLLIANFF